MQRRSIEKGNTPNGKNGWLFYCYALCKMTNNLRNTQNKHAKHDVVVNKRIFFAAFMSWCCCCCCTMMGIFTCLKISMSKLYSLIWFWHNHQFDCDKFVPFLFIVIFFYWFDYGIEKKYIEKKYVEKKYVEKNSRVRQANAKYGKI